MIGTLKGSWEKNWPEIDCALRGGVPQFVLSAEARLDEESVPVFCYHVPEARAFEEDLRHLARNGYSTLSADQLLDHLVGRQAAPAKSVVLTFDDGAVDVYRVAYPLLREYGFTAVAFVAPWFHDRAPSDGAAGRVCTWDELGEMHSAGVIDIQSHTFEHRLINRWPEPAPLCGINIGTYIATRDGSRTIEDDLLLAKTGIERRLGKKVVHLGFPCYFGTPEAIAIARSLGYEAFWWGLLPRIPDNRPGNQAAERIVRVSGEFLRRLPGDGRVTLRSILATRYRANLRRWRGTAGQANGPP